MREITNLSYEKEVLSRVKEERKNCKITEAEISICMGMGRSHYSKAENGHKRFGFNELVNMCSSNMDVYYIFTGKRAKGKVYIYDKYEQASNDQLVAIMKCINGIAGLRRKNNIYSAEWRDIFYSTYYINHIDQNIFRAVRLHKGMTQVQMAGEIGVDVKKWRDLETGQVLPDGELIYRMYKKYKVSPSIFLKAAGCFRGEIDYLLDNASDEVRKSLMGCIKFVLEEYE